MRNVYVSFLGLGDIAKDEQGRVKGYRPARYELEGRVSTETRFVQVAEIELMDGGSFDLVLILVTEESHRAHFDDLSREMQLYGVSPQPLFLQEDLGAQGQWALFEQLLQHIELGDRLSVDLTHGFRAASIVFSAAINFLQRAKNIDLAAVYYGAFDKNRQLSPIVDMKDFYVVNEWAEAVSRLVEDADARKMAQVAEKSIRFQVRELNDSTLILALDELTNAVRNVEVNTVAKRANKALALVRKRQETASAMGKLLLGLVVEKFVALTTDAPVSGRYDADYFKVQLAVARLLLEHRLYMQAYTVMREFVASLSMIPRQDIRMTNSEGRKRRERYGEVFVQMICRPQEEWVFAPERQASVNKLLPFYKKLECLGIIERIRAFTKDLTDFRNGFDHAWTSKVADFSEIEAKGRHILGELETAFEMIR